MDAGEPTAETPSSTFDTLADDLIAAASATAVPLGGRAAADPFYDFDEYVFLQDGSAPPSLANPYPDDPQLSRLAVLVDSGLYHWIGSSVMRLDPGWNFSPIDPATILHDWLMRAWTDACALDAVNHLSTYEIPPYFSEDYLFGAYANFLGQTLDSDPMAKNLAALYIKTSDVSRVADLVGVSFWRSKSDAALATVNGVLSWSQRGAEGPAADYPFTPFPTGKMLYGLRVIHRQTWRPLGYARGELVRTVPLGPKEIRRVSSKIVTRSKTTSTQEEATSQERTSDTASTTKDSSDVVSEASSKLNRHAEAEVSGGVPLVFSAKISAGISDEQAASDKTSKARLNETMEKTASRMKRDTKVTVSTEGETTFEESTAIELTNPNDEVAVTYLYHRLQQPFWVATEIAEVHSVVLVPEPLPDWSEVTESWIRRYGDVIAAVLLDPTYAAILASIRSEPPTVPLPDPKVFGDVLSKAMTATDTYVAFSGGGAMQDLLGAGATAYDRDYERRAARATDEARRQHQTDGLVAHIRRNILHYMRAIWNSEDYDQRMQRLSRLRTATAWAFTPWRGLPENADPTQVDGLFLPLPGSIRPLTEIIDPAGPIGYLFNCAIYLLRDDSRTVNLNEALSHLRAVYTRFDVTIEPSAAAGVTVTSAVAEAPVHFDDRFALLWREARSQWLESRPGVAEDKWLVAPARADGSLDWRGIRIWLTGQPADGATIDVHAQVTADLQDPHVRSLRIRRPLPPPDQDGTVFTDERLTDMAAILPGLPPPSKWSELDEATKARYRQAYHRYLALRETGRVVALDTANLVIDIETGAAVALEPFKRLHRYLDVLKAQEEYRRGQLDNARREALLGAGRLGDPDIEHLTVVDPAAAAFAVLETDGDKPK